MNTNLHWLHEKLVIFARANALKDTAREFGRSRKPSASGWGATSSENPSALTELSRRPECYPPQTPGVLEGNSIYLEKEETVPI